VTLQELRHLAVTLAHSFDYAQTQPTPAQHILSQYHAAYMDLQAAILGLSNDDAEKNSSGRRMAYTKSLCHILGADIGFTAVVRYALEGHRAGSWKPEQMSDKDETRLVGISEEEYKTLTRSPLKDMLAYHRKFHPEIISDFSGITDSELNLPATFWEETRFPIQHRLHRYEAHFCATYHPNRQGPGCDRAGSQ